MTLVNKGNNNEGYVFTLQRPDGAVLNVFEVYEDLCEIMGKLSEKEKIGYIIGRHKLVVGVEQNKNGKIT